MSLRLYLLATRCSTQLAMARYLDTDAPGNIERSAIRQSVEDPLWHTGYVQFREQYQAYLNDAARVERELGEESWAWADITDWHDTSATNTVEAKVARMPERMRRFLQGTNTAEVRYQWALAMDVELATKWLERAMKHTPDAIGRMAPRDQYNAIVDMAASYANYWKSINVSHQGWSKERCAWERVTRQGDQLVLSGPGARGGFPRPYAGATWWGYAGVDQSHPARDTSGAPVIDPRWDSGPWIAEAIEAINVTNVALGSPKPGIHGGLNLPRFGQGKMMQPLGPGPFGQPESASAPSSWDKTRCQEGVVVGSACFAPMRESHFFWINNDGMLTGGMDPLWHGITADVIGARSQWVASDRPYEAPTTWRTGDWRQDDHPPEAVLTIGYGRSTGTGDRAGARAVMFNWLTEYHAYIRPEDGVKGDRADQVVPLSQETIRNGTAGNFQGWLYQPPAKRYVDLLWPLLEYLAGKDPRAIAWEVMIDVMGKNAFASFVASTSTDAVQRSLEGASASFRAEAYARQQEGNALAHFVETITTMVVGGTVSLLPGGPLAGAAAGAGLNALFATINALEPSATRSEFLSNAKWDVFGRADAVPSGLDTVGMIERYLIVPATPQNLTTAQSRIYSSILRRTVNTADGSTQMSPASFVTPVVEPHDVPWPVGYEGPRYAPPGATGTPIVLSAEAMVSAYLQATPPSPEVRPVVTTEASGASPMVTTGTGALVGAAIGLALAAQKRPRANPSPRRARRTGRA